MSGIQLFSVSEETEICVSYISDKFAVFMISRIFEGKYFLIFLAAFHEIKEH